MTLDIRTLGFDALILGTVASAGPLGDWISDLGNPLLVFGRVCLYVGTLHFLGRPVRRLAISLAYIDAAVQYPGNRPGMGHCGSLASTGGCPSILLFPSPAGTFRGGHTEPREAPVPP